LGQEGYQEVVNIAIVLLVISQFKFSLGH